jgi:hypothetical protein
MCWTRNALFYFGVFCAFPLNVSMVDKKEKYNDGTSNKRYPYVNHSLFIAPLG